MAEPSLSGAPAPLRRVAYIANPAAHSRFGFSLMNFERNGNGSFAVPANLSFRRSRSAKNSGLSR